MQLVSCQDSVLTDTRKVFVTAFLWANYVSFQSYLMPLTRLSNNIHFTNQTQMPLSWGVSSETSASQKVENTAPSEARDVRVKSDPGTWSAGHEETGSLVLFQVVQLSGYPKGEKNCCWCIHVLTEAIRYIT